MPDRSVVLLHGPSWERSATRVGSSLNGVEVIASDNGLRNDILIRWGSVERVAFNPNQVINSRNAIVKSSNKLEANRIMLDNDICCPEVTTSFEEAIARFGFPLLGRRINHFGGQGAELYLQRLDLETYGAMDYYMPYIPKTNEYRVYVGKAMTFSEIDYWAGLEDAGLLNHEPIAINSASGKLMTLKVSEKVRIRPPTAEQTNARQRLQDIIWNWDAGYSYRGQRLAINWSASQMALEAVRALGLDFGAVDVMRAEDGTYYVMEVNTAPAVESEHTLGVLTSFLRARITGQVNVQEPGGGNA